MNHTQSAANLTHTSPTSIDHLRVFEGTATVFIERESHRLVWVAQPHGEPDVSHAKLIKQGDFLVVKDQTGKTLFEGDIDPSYSLLSPVYTLTAIPGHPIPDRGFEVSWHQKGWEPNAWANLFISGSNTVRVARPGRSTP
jgi:hypothetical protein